MVTMMAMTEDTREKLRANAAKAREAKAYNVLLRRREEARKFLAETEHLVHHDDEPGQD